MLVKPQPLFGISFIIKSEAWAGVLARASLKVEAGALSKADYTSINYYINYIIIQSYLSTLPSYLHPTLQDDRGVRGSSGKGSERGSYNRG